MGISGLALQAAARCALAAFAFLVPVVTIGAAQAGNMYDKIVDRKGNIQLPEAFGDDTAFPKGWVDIGTFTVVNENGEGNGVHIVYTTPDVPEAYRKTGKVPDKAVFVKSVRQTTSARLTTGQAHWATDPAVWFVMVKDAAGRFEGNPLWGDGWGWALFNADDPSKQVATDYKADCLGCHVPVQDLDWLHVFGYPSFGADARKMIPASIAATMPGASAAEAANGAAMGNADAGKKIFGRCAACHSLEAGQNRIGPSLNGVFGRKAGTAPGFNYSKAMKESNLVWNEETIGMHLADVKGFIPGNRMATLFPAGVKDPTERADLIAYLKGATAP